MHTERYGQAHMLMRYECHRVTRSSEAAHSKLRPLRGTRARHTPGPSCTLAPLRKNSSPMASPQERARAGSQVAATVKAAGNAVDVDGIKYVMASMLHMEQFLVPLGNDSSVVPCSLVTLDGKDLIAPVV